MGQETSSGGLTGKLFGRRLIVTVRGKDGSPLGNARVRIQSNEAASAVELVTRSDGRVVFVASWDNVDGDLTVTVTPPDGSAAVKQAVDRETGRCEVSLPAVAAPLPKNLDVVLLLDTTGSMGDELSYLKSEFKTIASDLAKRFPNVHQRYGLVLYRDRGDEYVTRVFDFTSSVDEFRNRLGAQSAAGGGDYPEAMEVGLEEAAKMQWRTTDTARVLFLVADAPPHAQDIGKAMAAADTLRKKGVAIYPLALQRRLRSRMRACDAELCNVDRRPVPVADGRLRGRRGPRRAAHPVLSRGASGPADGPHGGPATGPPRAGVPRGGVTSLGVAAPRPRKSDGVGPSMGCSRVPDGFSPAP